LYHGAEYQNIYLTVSKDMKAK